MGGCLKAIGIGVVILVGACTVAVLSNSEKTGQPTTARRLVFSSEPLDEVAQDHYEAAYDYQARGNTALP